MVLLFRVRQVPIEVYTVEKWPRMSMPVIDSSRIYACSSVAAEES